MTRRLILILAAALNSTCNHEVAVTEPYPFLSLVVPETAAQYDKIDIDLALATRYANPFDPDQIAIDAELTAPNGQRMVVPGFWLQDYERDNVTRGEPRFQVRFTPPSSGEWTVTVIVTDPTLGVIRSTPRTISVAPSAKPGFIRLSKTDPRRFAFDNGAPFFGIGENVAWGDVAFYDRVFRQLAESGANFARIWMLEGKLDLEWRHGVGIYDQARAWQLDRIFELAERHGIYLMLCLDNHGKYSTYVNPAYATNPYNELRGGPLPKNNPSALWTNAEAIAKKKQLYRYIIARYGHATALHSWELWNEMDWVGTKHSEFARHQHDAARWHSEMAAFFRAHDAYQHLITTSLAHTFDYTDALWSAMDFVQAHSYPRATPTPDIAEHSYSVFDELARRFPNKPYWLGELGIAPEDVNQAEYDPNGDMLHEALWSSVVANAAGTTMPWWWDTYVDALNLYPRIAGVAAFLLGEDNIGAQTRSFESRSGPHTVRARVLLGLERVLGWLQNPRDKHPSRGPANTVADVELTLSDIADGAWRVEWWSPTSGVLVERQSVTATNGQLTLRPPAFTSDLAFKLFR